MSRWPEREGIAIVSGQRRLPLVRLERVGA